MHAGVGAAGFDAKALPQLAQIAKDFAISDCCEFSELRMLGSRGAGGGWGDDP